MMNDITSGTDNVQSERQAEAEQLAAKGKELLLHDTKAAEAAGTFSQALQLAPNLLAAHLGMAEANFALGQNEIARMAAEYVQRLAPGSNAAQIAQALLLCLDHKYGQAIEVADQLTRSDPGNPYVHALRGYILRCLRNDYDAALAEAKAARLAGAVDLRAIFPRIERAAPVAPLPFEGANMTPQPDSGMAPRLEPVQPSQWQPSPAMRRNVVRTRLIASNYPVATYTIIGICVAVFLLQQVNPGITDAGAQVNFLVEQGQWYRLFTVMFLHENITHIFFNMLSLFFIGPFVERIYGTGRYLVLYFGTGLIASLAFLLFAGPNAAAVGASGAIAGIFGALGAFFFAYRNQLGQAANSMLQQWLFWLGLNVVLNVVNTDLAWQAHLGGLLAGLVLGYIFAPKLR